MSEVKEKRTKVLANGAVYDLDKKQIVSGAVLSSAQASILAAKRVEKRREIIRQAANEAVQRSDYKARYGSDAWIAALAETAFIKATTPDDPKAIEAARWLMRESGEGEEVQKESASVPLAEIRGLLHDIASVARALPVLPDGEVIDESATDQQE